MFFRIQLVSLVLVGIQLALLVAWTNNVGTRASVPSATLAFVDSVAIFLLISFGHSRSVRPLSVIALYLLFSVCFNAVELRTLYLRHEPSGILGLSTTVVAVKLFLLFLEIQSKRRYLRSPYRSYSPEATSGVVDRSVFWWLNPLIVSGFKKVLTLDDLNTTDPKLSSEHLKERIEISWQSCTPSSPNFEKAELNEIDRSTGEYALLKATLWCFRWELASTILPRLCYIGFSYAQPFLISALISYIGTSFEDEGRNNGYGLIGATALAYLGIAVSALLLQ